MVDKSLVDLLGKIDPERLQDLLAALDLVSYELKYAKDAVDSALKQAINQNRHDEIPKLNEVSKALYQYSKKVDTFLEENPVDESDDNGNEELEDTAVQEGSVDYSDYDVDDSIPHDLFVSVTHKKPAAFSYKGRKYKATQWNYLLVEVCKMLCKEDRRIFASFVDSKDMQGKRKPRFSRNKDALRKGVIIGDSGVYVETNRSANGIRKTILAMLEKYGMPSDTIKLYIRRDLTSLHKRDFSK